MVTDTMPEHPKIEALSDAAFRLLLETWCYCSRQLNDGRLSAVAWQRRGSPRARRELEDEGLVDEAGDGWVQVHDWAEHQRTAAEVRDLSEKRAAAGAAGGRAKAANRVSKPVASAKQVAKQTPSKPVANGQQSSSRVEESRVELASGGAASQRGAGNGLANASDLPTAQTLLAEWIDHCPERPPSRVVGQVAKELAGLLNDGLPYEAVRAGLAQWQRRGLNPSLIASVVHEMRTAGGRPPTGRTSTNGLDLDAAMARAQAREATA